MCAYNPRQEAVSVGAGFPAHLHGRYLSIVLNSAGVICQVQNQEILAILDERSQSLNTRDAVRSAK